MHRAQARRSDRRGESNAAAAERGSRRWIGTHLQALYHNRAAQTVGSMALCGLLGGLIALAGAG